MELTEKRAIKESKPLWTFLAKTGKLKEDWPEWDESDDHYIFKGEDIPEGCFLCEYSFNRHDATPCAPCPYYRMFGHCLKRGAPFDNWTLATTEEGRKKYAQEFLNQLNML